jgi:peptidase M16-like protein
VYDAAVVTEDSERGMVLGVPAAPGDPYAALSLYLLEDPGVGSAAAASWLQRRLATSDHDIELHHEQGVLTVTASCPPTHMRALLTDLGEALAASATVSSCPNERSLESWPRSPTSASGIEALLRQALFVENEQLQQWGEGWAQSPLVIAVTDTVTDGGTTALATAKRMLDVWPGRGSRRRIEPAVTRDRPVAHASDPSDIYRLGIACPAAARDDPRYRACALAAMHLAAVDGPVSRRLRRDASVMYTVAAQVHPQRGTGWMSLVGVVRNTPRVDAEEVFRHELARLVTDPPDDQRLLALQTRLALRIARFLADNRGRCSDTTSGVLYGLPMNHQLHISAGIAGTTRDDVATGAESLDLSRLIALKEPLA